MEHLLPWESAASAWQIYADRSAMSDPVLMLLFVGVEGRAAVTARVVASCFRAATAARFS